MSIIASVTERSLRELTDEEFATCYGCDRFTATVLSSRFRYIIKHMCAHLMTNAFSVVLRDWYDFAATISGPPELGFPMAAVSDSLMLFSGTMSEAVRNRSRSTGPRISRRVTCSCATTPSARAPIRTTSCSLGRCSRPVS